ncbi:MAG: hypothetical protein ACLUTA_05820 [Blautia wexlerae]
MGTLIVGAILILIVGLIIRESGQKRQVIMWRRLQPLQRVPLRIRHITET